ncbi:hypothetical protein FOL47_004148 [Perkinsus chesapeaki]|uniref:Uncharacterized protein n=1 Tax=Perkinsus chesapeaki TaxID=330153 RepID=A0A7J6M412_PERCH|nr:hypothetical protein FOL47_004148 [Perkinsus chesapeaki]
MNYDDYYFKVDERTTPPPTTNPPLSPNTVRSIDKQIRRASTASTASTTSTSSSSVNLFVKFDRDVIEMKYYKDDPPIRISIYKSWGITHETDETNTPNTTTPHHHHAASADGFSGDGDDTIKKSVVSL